MKNLLEFLLLQLVDHPDQVRVEEQPDNRGIVFYLHVHPEDMGRVIGKGGSVIQAIRNIAKIRAIKEGIRAHIVLVDPEQDGQTGDGARATSNATVNSNASASRDDSDHDLDAAPVTTPQTEIEDRADQKARSETSSSLSDDLLGESDSSDDFIDQI